MTLDRINQNFCANQLAATKPLFAYISMLSNAWPEPRLHQI
jgi:hypothetical protein